MAFLTEEKTQTELTMLKGASDPYPTVSAEDKVFGTAAFMGTGSGFKLSSFNCTLGYDNFTISLWIKVPTWPPGGVGVDRTILRNCPSADPNTQSWNLIYNQYWSELRFQGRTTAYTAVSCGISELPVNEWFHLAIVRQSGTWWLFINGVIKHTRSYSHDMGTSTRDLYINYSTSEEVYFQNTYLDDIWITKEAVWTSPFTPPSSPATVTANTKFLAHLDEPQYRISGNITEDSRVLVLNESNWALENSEDVTAGNYELSVSAGEKTIIAIPNDDTNNLIGYRNVTPTVL
jgi:hypothetical protein